MQIKTDVVNLTKDIETGCVINTSNGLAEAKRIKEKLKKQSTFDERITKIENTLETILQLLQK